MAPLNVARAARIPVAACAEARHGEVQAVEQVPQRPREAALRRGLPVGGGALPRSPRVDALVVQGRRKG